jgi:serine/threonine-protein kinase
MNRGSELTLGRNEVVTFGGDRTLVDFPVTAPRLPGVLGTLTARSDHWSISNHTGAVTMVVENLRGQGFATVTPGMYQVPMPFSDARVLVLARSGLVGFTVHTDLYLGARGIAGRRNGAAVLDEDTKYFLVLVALCEPALRFGTMVSVPTSREIAATLRRLDQCQDMSPEAVQYHLHYVLNHKLREHVHHFCRLRGRSGFRHQRVMLAELSMRFNLVSREHLRLLEPELPPRPERRRPPTRHGSRPTG